MGLKGIVFTLDVVIAIITGILILTLFPLRFETLHQEFSYQNLETATEDILNVLSHLRAESVKQKSTISYLLERGVLKKEDLNKTILDLIGSFWYTGNKSVAENISREVLENMTKNICLNLTTDNEVIYSSCNTTPKAIAVSSKITSGYEVGKPVSGYIARAWATGMRSREMQKVIDFNPLGSGWGGRPFEATKKFQLPSNILIKNGTLYLSMHYGKITGEVGIQNIKINGVEKKTKFTWLFHDRIGNQYASFGYVDITDELEEGWNEVYIKISSPFYHAHLHPGGRVEITYESNQTEFSFEKNVNETIYFDNVYATGTGWSGAGAWAFLPFFLPTGSSAWNVTMILKANSVEDKPPQWVEGEWHEDVEIYLNGEKVLVDPSPPSNPLYILTNSTLAPYLKAGTNVFSVFLNTYGDEAWGKSPVEIYSNPQDDPLGSSRVEVSYIYEKPAKLGYLQVDLTKLKEYGPPTSANPREANFILERKPVEAFNHLVEGFSSMVELKVRNESGEYQEFFKSKVVREVPTTTFIPPEYLSNGTNFIYARDFQPAGWTSPFEAILKWSTVEYTILVPAAVSYGDVFEELDDATEDAEERLKDSLKLFDIEISEGDIVVDSQSIAGIRWLWGPSLFKLVVWR
ncbi:MAG: hypothetical protein QMD14_01340 [Candidatus Aenigmarchaeota archaeon]|nr:hypothetical protein [Candidatus Aenigmarchaeota archaeon]